MRLGLCEASVSTASTVGITKIAGGLGDVSGLDGAVRALHTASQPSQYRPRSAERPR